MPRPAVVAAVLMAARRACEAGSAGEIVVRGPAFGNTQRLASPTDEAARVFRAEDRFS